MHDVAFSHAAYQRWKWTLFGSSPDSSDFIFLRTCNAKKKNCFPHKSFIKNSSSELKFTSRWLPSSPPYRPLEICSTFPVGTQRKGEQWRLRGEYKHDRGGNKEVCFLSLLFKQLIKVFWKNLMFNGLNVLCTVCISANMSLWLKVFIVELFTCVCSCMHMFLYFQINLQQIVLIYIMTYIYVVFFSCNTWIKPFPNPNMSIIPSTSHMGGSVIHLYPGCRRLDRSGSGSHFLLHKISQLPLLQLQTPRAQFLEQWLRGGGRQHHGARGVNACLG